VLKKFFIELAGILGIAVFCFGCSGEIKLTASDGATDNLFGLSVSISGDYVIVVAPEDDDTGWDSGSAYIYEGISL